MLIPFAAPSFFLIVTTVPFPTVLLTVSLSIKLSITANPNPALSSQGAVVYSGSIARLTSGIPQPLSLILMYISLSLSILAVISIIPSVPL